MSYEQVKDLPPAEFKRYCRVRPETFRKMVEVVSGHLSRRRLISGRPTKLSVVDQLLMTLEYWREYRTFTKPAVEVTLPPDERFTPRRPAWHTRIRPGANASEV